MSRYSLDCEFRLSGKGRGGDVPWVAGDPDFGEAENVDAFLSGVGDDGYCFRDGALEVEPDGLSLDSAEADGLFFWHG